MLALWTVLAGLTAASCTTNELGKLSAQTFGDLSNPPLPRIRYDAELGACGDGASAAGNHHLHRLPAVQNVRPDAAVLVWAGEGARVRLRPGPRADAAVIAAAVSRDRLPRPPRFPQWTARATELSPDTVYCYELVRKGEVLYRAGFRTAPTTDTRREVRLAIMGDFGKQTSDQRAVRAQLDWYAYEAMVLLGDLAYEDGTRRQFERNVFAVYADLLARIPAFPAAGNHDLRTRDGAPFREMFALPENGGPAGLERWYSFDWGPVHVVVLDSDRMKDDQLAWLDSDLSATSQPWIIVAQHKPLYSSGHHGSDLSLRRRLEPLLTKHKVNLVFTGHEHHYERSHPVGGVIHIISGGGGRGTRPVGRSTFTAYSQQVAHFVVLGADTERLHLHAIDATGVEFDSLVLQRRDR